MKRRMKLGAVAMLAMLSLAVGTTTSASASHPELEGAPAMFTGAQVGTSELTTFATITCSAGSISGGELASTNLLNHLVITMTGCKEPLFSTPCSTSKLSTGTNVSEVIAGALVYLQSGSSEVGIVLTAEAGSVVFRFTCSFSGAHEVKGAMICHLTPINVLSNSGQLSCKKSGSTQEPTSYLTPSGCGLASGVTLKDNGSIAAFKGLYSITYSKALKLNSTKCT
jgi:hypothetical protein